MRTRLVQIGNSRGVRLPKNVLAEAQLDDEIELKAEPGCILIRSVKRSRMGWADAAKQMRERGEDELLDSQTTDFDQKEWEWR